MASLDIEIKIDGDDKLVQQARTALINREPLHRKLATAAESVTKAYVKNLKRHSTANRLGAKPTKHHAKAAAGIESKADDKAAHILIPRASGLGRAFYDFELVPGAGKKYLTVPNDARTHGKRAGEFGDDAFNFVSFGGRHFALLWKSGSDKGEVAYWLKKKLHIDQDRTLLPSEEIMIKLSTKVITTHIRSAA